MLLVHLFVYFASFKFLSFSVTFCDRDCLRFVNVALSGRLYIFSIYTKPAYLHSSIFDAIKR